MNLSPFHCTLAQMEDTALCIRRLRALFDKATLCELLEVESKLRATVGSREGRPNHKVQNPQGITKGGACSRCKAPRFPELDLDDPADAVQFLLSKFKAAERDKLQPVYRFFVQELRKGKKEPLVDLLRKEVIGPEVLDSGKGRQSRAAAWSANRAQRFVTVNM